MPGPLRPTRRPTLTGGPPPLARRASSRLVLVAAAVLGAVFAALGGAASPALAQEEEPPAEQLSWREAADPVVAYGIRARLVEGSGPGGHMWIVGDQIDVRWTNTADEPATHLYFHLYANAFRSTRSSFLRERAQNGRELPDEMVFGGVDVRRLRLATGEELELEFVSPDDGNPDDRTVARTLLPEPVAPGDSVSLRMEFTTKLPTIVARMGQHRGFVMAAQWYPKLGRFVGSDPELPNVHDGWKCHQFHYTTEFYADFADYDVTLELPADLKVGATGRRVADDPVAATPAETDDPRRVLRYEARGVVDFAWTADAGYLVLEREIDPLGPGRGDGILQRERDRLASLLDLPDEDLALPPVKVRLLLQPEHENQAKRHFDAARVALAVHGLWLGPYPYDELTIVDPAFGADAAGGMEYPQLVTAGTYLDAPRGSLTPEGVIIHEIGHQWFMNVLATNEAEEAWLDEGLTTYFHTYALSLVYGPARRIQRLFGRRVAVTPFFEFGGVAEIVPSSFEPPEWLAPPRLELLELWRDLPSLTAVRAERYARDPMIQRRSRYLGRVRWDPLGQPGWKYRDRRSYGNNAYNRALLLVNTLRRSLAQELGQDEGERRFAGALRTYARRHRFGHPTADDLIAAFRDVAAGTSWSPDPYIEELTGTTGLDFAIEAIEDAGAPELRGLDTPSAAAPDDEGGGGDKSGADAGGGDDDEPARTRVVLRRVGEAALPVLLEVTREDGRPDDVAWESRIWDPRASGERWTALEFEGEIRAARLDPHGVYLQDLELGNNSLRAEPDPRPGTKWSVRFLLWLENALLSYGRFF